MGGTRLKPISRFGLTVMSIGFLIEEETPMIWRGPMVMSAITQMLREVEWGDLDIMVVDMPPGTGDAQLTMAQQVPLAGSVIVSTPQDLALIDARRGIAMFNRVNVPVLGIVENMSFFLCPHCGERSDIFGHGGARKEAERLKVPFLGEVPLDMAIRETSDSGLPVVATQPDGPHAKIYREIAAKVRDQLAGRRPDARRAEDRDRGLVARHRSCTVIGLGTGREPSDAFALREESKTWMARRRVAGHDDTRDYEHSPTASRHARAIISSAASERCSISRARISALRARSCAAHAVSCAASS